MTTLQTRNNNTASQIDALTNQLAEMQKMIAQMQSEMRVLNQQHKAQETLSKEWTNTNKTIEKQLKDACSVYGSPEAIDDMVNDVINIAQKVKESFEEHAQSDRFLNQETAIEEDKEEVITETPLLESPLPSEDDDVTVLSSKNLERIISDLNGDTVYQLKTIFNIRSNLTKPQSIAKALEDKQLTHYKLRKIIANIEGQLSLLAGIS